MYKPKITDDKWKQWGIYQRRLQQMQDDITNKLEESKKCYVEN